MNHDRSADFDLVAPPRNNVFLSPCAIFCAPTPTMVNTILGSCVSVCLWDMHLRIGGMNHYLLPRRLEDHRSPRFGDAAIDRLLDGMKRLGCRIESLRARIFGGAEVLPFGAGGDTIGEQNVRIALERMRHHGIPILSRRTGGHVGILIRLYTDTGDVQVRRLAIAPRMPANPAAIAAGLLLAPCGER